MICTAVSIKTSGRTFDVTQFIPVARGRCVLVYTWKLLPIMMCTRYDAPAASNQYSTEYIIIPGVSTHLNLRPKDSETFSFVRYVFVFCTMILDQNPFRRAFHTVFSEDFSVHNIMSISNRSYWFVLCLA